jgi:hypothetical protein
MILQILARINYFKLESRRVIAIANLLRVLPINRETQIDWRPCIEEPFIVPIIDKPPGVQRLGCPANETRSKPDAPNGRQSGDRSEPTTGDDQ